MALINRKSQEIDVDEEIRRRERWEAHQKRQREIEQAEYQERLNDPSSKEYKEAEKQRIQDEKDAAKYQQTLERSGLDFDNYSDDELREVALQGLQSIASKMDRAQMASFWALLGSGYHDDAKIQGLLGAQMAQGWILVRQNEAILRELKKLNTNLSGQ